MATEQIPTTLIADDAVTNAKIGADAVSTTEIANDASISTSGNIATTGSGTLTVAGTSTLTGALTASGGIANAGTISAGTIGGNVVFPDGMVINEKVLYTRRETTAIATSNTQTSFSDTGIAGSFQTRASSTDADMLFIIYSGMMHSQSPTIGSTAICLTTSSNTTHSDSNDLLGGSTYKNYFKNENDYSPTTMVIYNHFITYSAGDTLYWRVFIKKSTSDGNNFFLYHSNSTLYIIMKEILK